MVMTLIFVIVDPIWSLSAKKISLCLAHLVPEIHGHKVGLI